MPYGLVLINAFAKAAQVAAPVTESMIAISGLISGKNFKGANELIEPPRLSSEAVDGLLALATIA